VLLYLNKKFETKLKNNKDMILVIGMAVLIWFLWGAAFDPTDKKGRVERVIAHPKRYSRAVMRKWIQEAEDVLLDPDATDKERADAIRDIDTFSRYL
jgi:hypothetical protein